MIDFDIILNPSKLIEDIIYDPLLRHYLGLGIQNRKMNLLQEQNYELVEQNEQEFESGMKEGVRAISHVFGAGDTLVLFNSPDVPESQRVQSVSDIQNFIKNDATPEQLTEIVGGLKRDGIVFADYKGTNEAEAFVLNKDTIKQKTISRASIASKFIYKNKKGTLHLYKTKPFKTKNNRVTIVNRQTFADKTYKMSWDPLDINDTNTVVMPDTLEFSNYQYGEKKGRQETFGKASNAKIKNHN